MRIRAISGWAFIATLFMSAGGCGNSGIDPNLPAITTQPADATAKVGSTATFTVVATGQAPLSYQWFVFAKKIAGATSPSYTTGTLAVSDNNSFYFCLVTNSLGSIESNEALLTVTSTSPNPGVHANTLGNANPSDVLTLHNDAARTGQYLAETSLKPTNVNSAEFGKLGTLLTDGQVDAQPLYASGVTLPSGDVRNILYAATEHGSVYAFDAATGSVIWRTSLVGANEQPADSGTCGTVPPQERAISATPVIDRNQSLHGAIYVIASTKDNSGAVIQRIHAIDIATGAELFGGPAQIQVSAASAKDGTSAAANVFDPAGTHATSGMELLNGNVYAVWDSNCGAISAGPWVMGFEAGNLNPVGSVSLPVKNVFGSRSVTSELAADSAGNLYLREHASSVIQDQPPTTGAALANLSDPVFKLSVENGISVAAVFVSSSDGTVKMFTVDASGLSLAAANQNGTPVRPTDAQTSFSSNGASDGIQWTIENNIVEVLHAFDAADLTRELYNSTQAPNSRDEFPAAGSTVSPTIAGGRVYLATKDGIVVFGKLK